MRGKRKRSPSGVVHAPAYHHVEWEEIEYELLHRMQTTFKDDDQLPPEVTDPRWSRYLAFWLGEACLRDQETYAENEVKRRICARYAGYYLREAQKLGHLQQILEMVRQLYSAPLYLDRKTTDAVGAETQKWGWSVVTVADCSRDDCL